VKTGDIVRIKRKVSEGYWEIDRDRPADYAGGTNPEVAKGALFKVVGITDELKDSRPERIDNLYITVTSLTGEKFMVSDMIVTDFEPL
jgi:hypothetical protein